MNWISVDERLPEIGSSGESSIVLVWRPVRKEILLGYYANYIKGCGLWYEHTTGNRIDKPTHWMPLPDPPVEYLSSPQVTPECSCECWRCKGGGHCVRCNWGGNTAELGTCKVHQGHHRLLTSWNRETGCVEWTVLTPEEKFGWPLSGTGILIHGKHYTQRDPVGCEVCKSEDAKPVGSEVKPRTGEGS